MVEAPLLVKPYLVQVSRGELFVIMSAGMAGVGGTVMWLYAQCGFANLGILDIMVGGLATMAPGRRQEILQLVPRILVSGRLTNLSCGCVVGLLL